MVGIGGDITRPSHARRQLLRENISQWQNAVRRFRKEPDQVLVETRRVGHEMG
jgi:hypothetical protein